MKLDTDIDNADAASTSGNNSNSSNNNKWSSCLSVVDPLPNPKSAAGRHRHVAHPCPVVTSSALEGKYFLLKDQNDLEWSRMI